LSDAPIPADPPRRRRRWLRWLFAVPVVALLVLLLGLWALDTGPGHRFLADRIAALAPQSGLRIQVGRIEGSIYGRARLRDVRVFDPQGLVFSAPDILLDWRPAAWATNRLDINELSAASATLHKLPRLNPPQKRGPILPGFDIRIGALRIDRLTVAAPVAGQARVGRVSGRADIRDGRAMVRLDAAVSGGDRLALMLDAEPDRDRFDIDARLAAPAGGVFGAIIGTKRPVDLQVRGDGRWSAWAGTALLDMSGMRIADMSLRVDAGRYTLTGTAFPALVTKGRIARLTVPRVLVNGTATLADRRLDTSLSVRSAALAIDARGIVDLGRSAYDDMRIGVRLLQPPAMLRTMRGTDVALKLRLDGGFDRARFDYLLTSPRLIFDRTGFDRVRATGRGRLGPSPVSVPVRLTAARVTGVGDVAGGILANLSVEGVLRVTSKTITGDGLQMRSNKLSSRISLFVDLVTGRYDVGISGQLVRYLIPGLGIVDVRTTLKVVPGPNGRGTRVVGRGQGWVRRFDNAFLASLAGGLPRIETGLERGTDGILRLNGLRLIGPEISLSGNGYRRRDGTFFFQGGGRQARYGPVRLMLDGRIERPKLDLLLASPLPALGLADVRLLLNPTPAGFDYRAAGGSTLGPFDSFGAILLPRGAPARIQVAALNVSGTMARGELVSMPGGFDGKLAVSGGGISGDVGFDRVGELQRIALSLDARRAQLGGLANLSVARGSIDGDILLDPAGTTTNLTVTARGLRREGLALAQLAGNVTLKGGAGQVRAAFAGSRGRAFDLQGVATVAPDRVSIIGEGTIDRKRVKLTSPAVLTRDGGGWRLAETSLTFAGGSADVSGRFGKGMDEVAASVSRMPLTILDIGYPGLGLGGTASGRLSYRDPPDGLPTGQADFTVRGLTRSGLVLSSRPVDVGVKAVLSGSRAAARAVVASGGRTIGRAQARLAPISGTGPLLTRLTNAPLFAQLRYDGPADTLWRLTGVEIFDLSGPVAVGADMTGRLADPRISGSVRTTNARLESAVTGTVLTQVKATGRFGGSRLVIDDFTAQAGKEGSVAGRGVFDLAAARGFGIDLAVTADNAVLLDRDDIGATVTGPLTFRSDGVGGTIAGDVVLNRSRYRLGRAAAELAVPRLAVTEVNRRADDAAPRAPPAPWLLDLKAVARNRLTVTGLGLDSEWRANLVIGGAVTAPAITGEATLLRGDYEFAGRTFDLERGTIRFGGASPPDPVLDIAASASLQGLNATIRVTGTGLKPEIAFTSVPALPEDELLSRLLFGTSITNLSAPEALQLASAVAGLQSDGGIDPINAVRRAAGLDRLRILPADPTLGQGTSIAAGKYITRRTFVEVITDGQGYSATRVEFQITRWLSLLSSISTLGRQSANVRVSRDY
jgi:translocation and assembly module TamB